MEKVKVYTVDNMEEYGIDPNSKEGEAVTGLLDAMNSRYQVGAQHSREGFRALAYDGFMTDLQDDRLRRIFFKAYRHGYEDVEVDVAATEYPAAHALYEQASEIQPGNFDVSVEVALYLKKRYHDNQIDPMVAMFKIGFLKGQRAEKARAKKARQKSAIK